VTIRIAFDFWALREGAVRHVGDGKILDDLAAFQGEVAHLVELVGRIGGTVSGNWARERADQHQAGDRERDEMAHGEPPR
jgi:hypothetical protein